MRKVLVTGGGPSAAAVTITLCQLGVNCVVIDGGFTAQEKFGESLPPNANDLIKHLQLEGKLKEPDHQPCYGNLVNWGSEKLMTREFIKEPYGMGWHLDRKRFEYQLKSVAVDLGAEWTDESEITGLELKDGLWEIDYKNPNGIYKSLTANFIVDATGRNSHTARRIGVRKVSIDNLMGYVSVVENHNGESLSNKTFIESVEDGWWYAASLPGNKAIVNFMSDSDIHRSKDISNFSFIEEKLDATRYLKTFVKPIKDQNSCQIICRPASTSFLENIVGENWLAVGDAACTYDPLTSYGLVSALGSGIYAARAINDHFSGNKLGLSAYELIQQRTFKRSLVMLKEQYNKEVRWPQQEFWKRRQGAY